MTALREANQALVVRAGGNQADGKSVACGAGGEQAATHLRRAWDATIAALSEREAAISGAERQLAEREQEQVLSFAERERELESASERLRQQRERLRSELEREADRRIEKARIEADQRVRQAARGAEVAGRQAEEARNARQAALIVEATARRLADEAEQARVAAVRRASALIHRFASENLDKALLACWYRFPSEDLEAVEGALAVGLAGSKMREQIEAASEGVTQLPYGEGLVEVVKHRSGGALRLLSLTRTEPIPDRELPDEAQDRLDAHWHTTVSVWQEEQQVGVSIDARAIDAPPLLPASQLRGLAQALLEAARPEDDAGWPLGTRATCVEPCEVDELVEFLRDGARLRPVLVISDDLDGRTADSADELAAVLCGTAHVTRLSRASAFELTRLVSAKLSVWGGHARCYLPGFSQDSPPRRHPTLDPKQFSPPEQLRGALLSLACLEQVPREVERARMLGWPSRGKDVETGRDLLLATEQASLLGERVRELEAQLDAEREHTRTLVAALSEDERPHERDQLRTVADAVRLARDHAKHLRFAAKAFYTAAESPYRPAHDVYDALMLLDQLAGEYTVGEIGTSVAQRAGQLGLTWRSDVSQLAKTKYASDYTASYEEWTLALGPHLLVGGGAGAGRTLRAYLHLSPGGQCHPQRGIYVGHVGRHLPDTTTG